MQQKYLNAYIEYSNSVFSTIDEICIKHGFCKSSFYRALKKENLELPKKQFLTSCSEEKMNTAEKMYNDGNSIKTIASKLNMGEKTISKYLRFKKIKIRGEKEQSKNLFCNYDFFETIDTEEKAYWLGFIYADGCVTMKSSGYKLSIELCDIDIKHLEKFKKHINSNHLIKNKSNKKTSYITICNKKITQDLSKYGCIPNKTSLGFIKYDLIPDKLTKDFLRGFLDGDGFIDKKRYRIVYTIKLLEIAETIQKLFLKHNIYSKIIKENGYHRLNIENKNNFYNALEFLYSNSNIYLDRKYDIYIKRINEK